MSYLEQMFVEFVTWSVVTGLVVGLLWSEFRRRRPPSDIRTPLVDRPEVTRDSGVVRRAASVPKP